MKNTIEEHEDINLHIKKSSFKALLAFLATAYISWGFLALFVSTLKYFPKDVNTSLFYLIPLLGAIAALITTPFVVLDKMLKKKVKR